MKDNTNTFYDIPLGVNENNEVVILDYAFEYSDEFKGCTGDIIRPVYTDEYVDRLSEEALADTAKDCWKDQVSNDMTELGLEDWIEEAKADLESSAIEEYDFDICDFPELNIPSAEDIECWELIGCGRVFGHDLKITQRSDQYDELIKVLKDHDEL